MTAKNVPIVDQVREAKRLLEHRRNVVTKRVAEGFMRRAQAERQLALIAAIVDTLEELQETA